MIALTVTQAYKHN